MVDEYLLKICLFCCPDELLTPSLRSYADRVFDPSSRSTTGCDISTKQIMIDNDSIKLILVDISTNRILFPANPSFIRGASIAVFAFSKRDQVNVMSALDHYHEFRDFFSEPTVPVAFIGFFNESEGVTEAQFLI